MRAPSALCCILLVVATSCSDPARSRSTRAEVAARVACASVPAEALVRAVVGGAVPVVRPVPADADPAHWTPARGVIAELQDARRVVLAGAGLEAWTTGVSLPASRVVDAAAGTEARWIELEIVRHTHGAGEEHSHEGHDAHAWLDPDVLRHQLERVYDEVLEAFPDAAPALLDRRAGWRAADDAYRARLAEVRELVRGRPLLTAWPCYGYLARALGTTAANCAFDPWAPDGGPTTAGLRRAEDGAAGSAGVLLWPVLPPAELAAKVQEATGLVSVHFDALLRPAEGELFERLSASLDRLADAVR